MRKNILMEENKDRNILIEERNERNILKRGKRKIY